MDAWIPPGVAFPAVENAVVRVAVPGVSEPGVDVAAVAVVELAVVFVAAPAVSGLGVFFAALVSVADACEPQASVDTVLASAFLVPVSGLTVEVYSPGRPRIVASPNSDCYSSPSSSVAGVG